MAVKHYAQLKLQTLTSDDVDRTAMTNVIGAPEGWESHTLRVFRIEPGGHTPRHQHDWEHVNYCISGSAKLRIGDEVTEFQQGDFAFVPPNTDHQFTNPFDEAVEFICIVPNKAYKQ
jgi:quercetin dioxygenase-like cupin family protein